MASELPPWLNISPLAPVPMYLQGYSQGASVGESRRRSEERAYEADLQAAAQQERNDILREARQIQAQEFAENLKLKQEAAQRAAKMAAIRLEGQQGLERGIAERIARGETPQQAFQSELPRHAPKLLFEEPASMAQLFRQTQPERRFTPEVMDFEGEKFLVNPATGKPERLHPSATERIDAGLAPGLYQRGNRVFRVTEEKPAKPHPLQKELDKKRAELAAAKAGLVADIAVPPLEAAIASMEQTIAQAQAAPETTSAQPSQTKAKGDLVKISTREEYGKLPAGTDYIAPDGSIRHKK